MVLCDSCKEPFEASQTEKEFLNHADDSPLMIYRATGCSECNQHGYKGRLGIYEVVNIDENMRELIHRHAGELELEEQARKSGPSIRDDGVTKVLAGVTTIEEVVRVTHGD